MNFFSWIFLFTLAASLALEYWLLWRQRRSVKSHRHAVPHPFEQRITLPQHQKAADYTLARVCFQQVSQAVGALVLLGWTFGGGLDLLDRALAQWIVDPLWQGTALMVAVLVISTLLDLPLELWSTFGIESRFGFNRTSARQFLVDHLLQLTLLILVGGALALVFLWFMTHTGRLWWLWAWGAWMAFLLLTTWAWPTFIAPLFNRFKPLEDEALRQRLEALLTRNGFRSGGIFVMDGSRRSSHGNAYFTGLGKTKRIVFYDTLLESLSPEEIEAVLAHELGHFKRHHVLKNLLTMAAVSFLGLALAGWLLEQPWFYTGLGVHRQTPALGLSLFLLVIPVFATFFTPLFAMLSRRYEFEADDFAARQVSAQALIDALIRMYRDNASTLTPDRLYSAFHHSHPPATVRIAHLSSKIKTESPEVQHS